MCIFLFLFSKLELTLHQCLLDKADMSAFSKVVIDLMGTAGLFEKGYVVHTDNLYTSPCLFHYLQSRSAKRLAWFVSTVYAKRPATKGPW